MKTVTGKYKVAGVRFIDGAYVVNNTKIYYFALLDDSIGVGDSVLCDTVNGMLVGVVENIDYNGTSNDKPTKEIVCKVDLTDFIRRKELREKKKELKNYERLDGMQQHHGISCTLCNSCNFSQSKSKENP